MRRGRVSGDPTDQANRQALGQSYWQVLERIGNQSEGTRKRCLLYIETPVIAKQAQY
jgi:hypothetical protein